MNQFKRLFIMAALMLTLVPSFAVGYTTPKQEFRSAWVATVWRLDWPSSVSTTAYGNKMQQEQLTRMLDSLKNCNFNAICFQVRSMCDAMYRSSYEPWSSYLTDTRGRDPGWDPLAFAVEECHKRGMECHAWVNPYRFSTNGVSQWSTPTDEALKDNGQLLGWGNTIILDPAQQRNIDLIVNVCKEIIVNYDVDGLLYDDYFYPNGIPVTSEADDYDEWQSSGTTLTFADWRRDNVNRMVKAVYDMVQETRPDVRFGISPAGVAGTSAGKYGLTSCPAGSDWQYNGIFSDPLAWLNDKSIDYISPQVYWTIGSSNDYAKITPWWSTVAKHFERQVFISEGPYNTISSQSDDNAKREYCDEVEMTRTSSLDGAPGSIFYSVKYLYIMGNRNGELCDMLRRTTFTLPALPPAMPWKPGIDPGAVDGLALTNHVLSWNALGNHKYTVYAIPNGVDPADFNADVQYLLDITYSPQYTLPAEYYYGYYFAVCPVDRMDNEFGPAFLIAAGEPLPAPALLTPADGELTADPCTLSWNAVDGAEGYMVELATDAEMSDVIARKIVTTTSMLSSDFGDLRPRVFYWRVRACAEGRTDGVSEVRSFSPQVFTITYPENGDMNIHPSFTATWHTAGNTGDATMEIATDEEFVDIVFTGVSDNGQYVIEPLTLAAGTKYYMRVRMTLAAGEEKVTNVISFTTAFLEAVPPEFSIPLAGGTLYSDQYITLVPQEAASTYNIEISPSETVWGRTRYTETLKNRAYVSSKVASEVKVNSKLMVDGTTYYARATASYLDASGQTLRTATSTPIAFVYSSATAPKPVNGDVNNDGAVNAGDVSAVYNVMLGIETDATIIARADVNGDGSVNAGDVSAVYNAMLQ